MAQVVVKVTVKLVMDLDKGVEVSDMIEEMDYNFISGIENCEITEMEIEDYNQ